MRAIAAVLLLAACSQSAPEPPRSTEAVLEPVRAFYRAFGENFVHDADFATADWEHINPVGGHTKGRDAVLAEVRAVHKTFLKDVTDTITKADVRFASANVAVVTVESRSSPYALPGESDPIARRAIRTFVVVEREDGWKVMHDQNTEIRAPGQES